MHAVHTGMHTHIQTCLCMLYICSTHACLCGRVSTRVSTVCDHETHPEATGSGIPATAGGWPVSQQMNRPDAQPAGFLPPSVPSQPSEDRLPPGAITILLK